MGAFPFAATTRGITSPVQVPCGRVPGPGWRLRLNHPSRRLPRFDPIPKLVAVRQRPLALRRFAAYIQRVPFSRTLVRSPFAGGFWVAPTIERGPPAARA
jgi:hypothetical protein